MSSIKAALVAGDIVLVRAVVSAESLTKDFIYVRIDDAARSEILIERASAVRASQGIEVGDEVGPQAVPWRSSANLARVGIVAAIVDGDAWIEWGGARSIEPLASLRLIRTAAQVAANAPRPGEEPALPLAAE